MPSLAELIGKTDPLASVRLRQAVVASAPSGGTCSIQLGGDTTVLTGVHVLASASFASGDTVWVLQCGGMLLVLGKLNAGASPDGTQSVTYGQEIYHPSGNPYIDFHRAANPAGDGNADYNMRLINDAAGQISVLGGRWVVNSGGTDALTVTGAGANLRVDDRDNAAHFGAVYGTGNIGRLWRWDGGDCAFFDVNGFRGVMPTIQIRQTGNQSIPNTADTLIAFGTTDWARVCGSAAGTYLTFPQAGYYLIYGMVRLPGTAGGEHYTGLYFYDPSNTFQFRAGNHGGPSAGITTTQPVMTVRFRAANERVALAHFQSSGGTVNTDSSFGDIVLGAVLVSA